MELKDKEGNLTDEMLPYSTALKEKSKLIEREVFQLGKMAKKSMANFSYIGDERTRVLKGKVGEDRMKDSLAEVKFLMNFEDFSGFEGRSGRAGEETRTNNDVVARTDSQNNLDLGGFDDCMWLNDSETLSDSSGLMKESQNEVEISIGKKKWKRMRRGREINSESGNEIRGKRKQMVETDGEFVSPNHMEQPSKKIKMFSSDKEELKLMMTTIEGGSNSIILSN